MMRALLAASAVVLSSGCGTVWNLTLNSRGPEIYGGVQKDIEVIMTPASGVPGSNLQVLHNQAALLVFALIPAEVCLSFVGDSLTLPLVVYLAHREYCRDNAGPGKPATLGCDSTMGVDAGP